LGRVGAHSMKNQDFEFERPPMCAAAFCGSLALTRGARAIGGRSQPLPWLLGDRWTVSPRAERFKKLTKLGGRDTADEQILKVADVSVAHASVEEIES